MVVLYQPKSCRSTEQWRLRGRDGAGAGMGQGLGASGPGANVLVLLWAVVESQNGLRFWAGRDLKDRLVPAPFHGQRHLSQRPQDAAVLVLGPEGCGQVPVPPLGMEGGGVLPKLQPAPVPKRTCRRPRRGESERSTRIKGETSRTLSSPICPPRREQANFRAL